ncbi:hypothetical protein YC2023_090582 [Brassica napus]
MPIEILIIFWIPTWTVILNAYISTFPEFTGDASSITDSAPLQPRHICFSASMTAASRSLTVFHLTRFFHRDLDRGGEVTVMEILFICNILAFLGGRSCMIRDDHQSLCFGEFSFSEEVRVALGEKYGKEGIGNEIDLMISGDGAVSVVTNLSDLKLFGVVFALPSSSEPATSEKFSTYISFLLLTFGNLENRVP